MVAVPEAAVDEDYFGAAGEDHIWTAGERAVMKAVAVAHGMGQAADDHFGFGVLVANGTHDFAAFFFGKLVRHGGLPVKH